MPSTLKPPTPRCTAAVFAEQITFDQQTGFTSLLNVFSRMKVPGEPGQSGPFGLHVQLTDGLGDYEIAAELHDLDGEGPLARVAFPVRLSDRLEKAAVNFPFTPVTYPRFGRYDLVVTANGAPVMELTIDVEPLG